MLVAKLALLASALARSFRVSNGAGALSIKFRFNCCNSVLVKVVDWLYSSPKAVSTCVTVYVAT